MSCTLEPVVINKMCFKACLCNLINHIYLYCAASLCILNENLEGVNGLAQQTPVLAMYINSTWDFGRHLLGPSAIDEEELFAQKTEVERFRRYEVVGKKTHPS